MSYYYLAIGGSGAKVMESLTHLCAAGLFPNKERQGKLYVMAIDPDVGNGNLKRSSAVLNNIRVFQTLEFGYNTPLLKTSVEMADPFIWNPVEHDKKLDDVMAYMAYKGTSIGNLYEALYTQQERNTFLNEGFRGHPSIGAAVLAKKVVGTNFNFSEDEKGTAWKTFENMIVKEAKAGETVQIFLAGSVFGGTGAAGVPTMAQLLRKRSQALGIDDKVIIGGALILPYFQFRKPTDMADELAAKSENFLTNTQAALKYYAVKDKSYDAIYLIGDDLRAEVKEYSLGASSQNNDAHVVDFYGALAAIDFYQKEKNQLSECSYISRGKDSIYDWSSFPDIIMTADQKSVRVKDRLAHFIRFIFAYAHFVKPVLHELASGQIESYKYPWFVDYLNGLDVDTKEIRNFEEYVNSFIRWLAQLEKNTNQREVRLVRPNSFTAGDNSNQAIIEPSLFAECVFDEDTDLTMHEVWYRLSESSDNELEHCSGFGRFLRALYDSCEKR